MGHVAGRCGAAGPSRDGIGPHPPGGLRGGSPDHDLCGRPADEHRRCPCRRPGAGDQSRAASRHGRRRRRPRERRHRRRPAERSDRVELRTPIPMPSAPSSPRACRSASCRSTRPTTCPCPPTSPPGSRPTTRRPVPTSSTSSCSVCRRGSTDPGSQLWDELAALTLSQPDLVRWQTLDLAAETTGRTAGRIERTDDGREVTVALAADRPRVETAMLAALRRGPPRPHPFSFAGDDLRGLGRDHLLLGRAATGEGRHASADVSRTARRVTRTPSSVVVQRPHTWQELLDLIAAIQPGTQTQPPAWVDIAGGVGAAAGATGRSILDLPAGAGGMAGIICAAGDDTAPRLVSSPPVDLPG